MAARIPRRRRLSVGSLNTSFNADATPAKQSSIEPSDFEASFADLGENDDKEERKQNRRAPRRNSLAPMVTPLRSNRPSQRHRGRTHTSQSPYPPSNIRRKVYTNEQLSQIYKDCIIKAQQGKINQQNAWNLHLVDNIQEITNLNTGRNNSNNSNNNSNSNVNAHLLGNNAFARASHTIDAASKIYGYRVDSVHNKTYKVLGSIHQQENGVIEGDENERKRVRKERNRNVGKCTLIEQDKLYKISETMKNLCVEVDALFHKTASCFDEGGAKGLLMNTLYVQNGCDIVFDSTTKIEQNENITTDGVVIDHKLVEDESEINKEHEWMTQLAHNTFADFTQPIEVNASNIDFDISTQTKPQNFKIDMKWIERTSICPLLNVFNNNIKGIQQNNPLDLSLNDANNNNNISPEKDLNAPDGEYDDDNDIMMDMPDFTLTQGDDGLNAQDLFHEELMTQQQGMIPIESGDINNVSGIVDIPTGTQYILGQNGQNIIGNMGVQPLLDVSMNDNQQILNNLQLEVENSTGEYNNLHRQGIYKRGAMNINAMNNIISKLENADFESLTSFFDSKKHGNWAGPDQWYHRRYLMTLKKNNNKNRNSNSNSNNSNNNNNNESNISTVSTSPNGNKKKRKQRKSTRFDFMNIANGNLISETEFDEPPRAYNTLTQAVLDKNRKTYHTLPKDLQIKPDMFIKLFHRPNYSVWKHWLRQHQLRMVKQAEELRNEQNENGMDGMDGGMQLDLDGMGGGMDGMGYGGFDGGDDTEPQFIAQQAAAMAVIDVNNMGDDDDENEFKYDYNNPLDSSHFVPNMNDSQNDMNNFNFNYDLIDIDPRKRVQKIQVEFATTAKKVNVRKLKLRLWDKINNTLPMDVIDKENVNSNSNNNNDVDMENDMNAIEMAMDKITFQDTLNSLPSNLSSAISVHMCFICLLHLANEKVLQFVPKMNEKEKELERGDFEIEYANDQSAFEKDAQQINPIMVLGMQNN